MAEYQTTLEADNRMEHEKSCSICSKVKPLEDFYKRKQRRSGFCSACKVCARSRRRQSYQKEDPEKREKRRADIKNYHSENRDKAKARNEKFKSANPEYTKEYYTENRDKLRVASKKWDQENPDKAKARNEKWRKENPARNAAKSEMYRAKKLKATLPGHDKALYKFYAARKPGMHGDHIAAFKGTYKGQWVILGLHVPWNLQYLTAKENLKKGNYFNPADHFWTAKSGIKMPKDIQKASRYTAKRYKIIRKQDNR